MPDEPEAPKTTDTPEVQSTPEVSKPSEPLKEPTTAAPDLTPRTSSAGVLVLQWLTYAFWGWLTVGLIWLISVILVNAIVGESVSEIVPYAMAASIVLLPIAFVTDLFYRKHEPVKKAGAAMVIMIIHAVIFALFGIGALILTVFTGLNGLINAGNPQDVTITVILVAASATLLYAAAFLRTLNPFKKPLGARIYAFALLGLTIVLLILAVVGPVVTSLAYRGDQEKEQALQDITYAVQSYVTTNNAMPKDLSELTIRSDESYAVVKAGKVEYSTQGTEPASARESDYSSTSYRYTLCVTYDQKSKESSSYYNYDDYSFGGEYKTYLSVNPHDAGRVCYKLRT